MHMIESQMKHFLPHVRARVLLGAHETALNACLHYLVDSLLQSTPPTPLNMFLNGFPGLQVSIRGYMIGISKMFRGIM